MNNMVKHDGSMCISADMQMCKYANVQMSSTHLQFANAMMNK